MNEYSETPDAWIERHWLDEPGPREADEKCPDCQGDWNTIGIGGCTCDAEPVGVEATLNELYRRHQETNTEQ